MIGRIEGHIVEISDNVVLVSVGGVGYEVEISLTALADLARLPGAGGDTRKVVFYTHFVVREDAQQLFGFASRAERDLFRDLIRISGVGPKLALSLISALSLADLAAAVAGRDVSMLTRVPGVGRKTAERLLVELAGKLPAVALAQRPAAGAADRSAVLEAERALVALGYKPGEATRAVDALRDQDLSAEELVRAALRQLARNAEGAA